MPNFLYEIDGETGAVADLYVSGRVTQVEEGPSHSWDESGDREVRIEHPFNDPGAWTSQVRVTVEVDTAIAAPGQKTSADVELVQFGLSFPAPLDLDAVRRELMSYHRIAALYSGSAVYDHDPTLWAVMEDGAFLGIVDADGGVSFPAIEPGDEVRIEGVPFVPDDLTDLEDPEQTEPVVAVYDESADTWTRP